MKYFISMDGGGTKTVAVLVDSNYRMVSQGTGGALNGVYVSMESMQDTVRKCIRECMSGKQDISIETMYVSMPAELRYVTDALAGVLEVGEYREIWEGRMSVLAGLCSVRGGVAWQEPDLAPFGWMEIYMKGSAVGGVC